MKTRIVRPHELWNNDEFARLSKDSKLLLLYLVSNDSLGLTRYCYLPDRRITFDTGIKELKKAKQELTKFHFVFFYKSWVYQVHNFAYLDYNGRDRVMQAKEQELKVINVDVIEYFKGVTKGLQTGFKPVLNHKSQTLNPKSQSINYKSKTINPKSQNKNNKPKIKNKRIQEFLQKVKEKEKIRREQDVDSERIDPDALPF